MIRYETCDTCILPKFTHLVKFYQTSPLVHKLAWYNETKILLLCPNILTIYMYVVTNAPIVLADHKLLYEIDIRMSK